MFCLVVNTCGLILKNEKTLSLAFQCNLNARELDALRLLAEDHPDARIARTLVLSPRTVNTHLHSIYAKIGVSSRSAATRLALEHKLIQI